MKASSGVSVRAFICSVCMVLRTFSNSVPANDTLKTAGLAFSGGSGYVAGSISWSFSAIRRTSTSIAIAGSSGFSASATVVVASEPEPPKVRLAQSRKLSH